MHLRTILPALALSIVLLAPCALAQSAATQQEQDIVKVLRTQEAAWNKGDIGTFAQGYKNSPEILFIGHQISRGYAGMVSTYHKSYPTPAAMGTLSFSQLEVHRLNDNFAVCIGKFHLERGQKDGGNAEGIFSLVFEKTPQGWKIVIDHTAS